jgi:SAM-dependent methyltransferase
MCGSTEATVLGRRLSTHQGLRPTSKTGVATTVMRCTQCGLVYANPLPLPADIGQHYDTDPGGYWKPEYFNDDPAYFRDQAQTFRSLWGRDSTPVALDIGAGLGKAMRSLTVQGFDAHGIEPSPAFRDAAIAQGGIEPDRITLGAVEDADLPADTFDFVTFGAVLEHLADPADMIDRALHWTRPGGLVHIEVPSSDWLTARIFNLAYRAQGLDYVTNLSPMHPPFHLYEFTPASFTAHAGRNGHRVALMRRMTGVDTFLPGPDRAWRWLMARTGTGMQLEVWLRSPCS